MVDINIKVPALEKLLDYTASGIGSVAGSMLASWQAEKVVQAKLITAKGEAEATNIKAEGDVNAYQLITNAKLEAREKLMSQNTAIQEKVAFGELVAASMKYQGEKRLKNVESVVKLAAMELGEKDVPDIEPDHDFTARFFNDVQDVSSEKLQLLWANILSGEVENPGSTSVHSLSILKNLNQKTARIFSNFCSICIYIVAATGNDFADARVVSLAGNAASNSLKEYGLRFTNLNLLNEHGLIISDYNSWVEYSFSASISMPGTSKIRGFIPFRYQRQNWILVPADGHKKGALKLDGVALTRAGKQLSRVVECAPMSEYTRDLHKFFEKKGLKMSRIDSSD